MGKVSKIKLTINRTMVWFACIGFSLLFGIDVASAANTTTVGGMASNIIGSFTALAKLITAGAYLGGLAFSISAIMKFKQHKDNPAQISIGMPIALVFVAAALLFLPTILSITGNTMFGGSGGSVAGPSGTAFGTSSGS